MLIKLVGYVWKKGSFPDEKTGEMINFNNILLDVVTDTPMDNSCIMAQMGTHCSTLKIKHDSMAALFPPEIKAPADLNTWIGKEICLDYGLNGSKPVLVGIRLAK